MSKNSSKTHQKEPHHKIRQKTCQNIVKKIVKQDPRAKQVPFRSPQSGFQEAPHASQGGIQLKKCSGINNILIIISNIFCHNSVYVLIWNIVKTSKFWTEIS